MRKFFIPTLICCLITGLLNAQLKTTGSWLLNGNKGISSSNFLGTTDSARLIFKTVNQERMTILNNGHVGIGSSTAERNLVIKNSIDTNNAEVIIRQLQGSNLGAYLTLDNQLNGGQSWSIGSTGSLNHPVVTGSLEFYQYPAKTRMIIDSNGNVGIGLFHPTAQFHTTGSVRFEGITRKVNLNKILGLDVNGNLYFTDISSFVGWSVTGNAGTNPTTNFIGTTDNNSFEVRTNNIERLTVSNTGHLGLNNTSPTKLFSLQGINTSENAEVSVKQLSQSSLGAYLTLDNTLNSGKSWSIGSTGTLNSPTVAGALEFYELGFGTRMILGSDGKLGVNIGNGLLPTANLHARGTVRFQDLPSGSGIPLVIDANGNIYQSATGKNANADNINSQEIQNLNQQINELKSELIELRSLIAGISKNSTIDKPVLFQNSPNPLQQSTIIKFYVPTSQRGYISIADMNGRQIQSFPFSQSGLQQVKFENKNFSGGSFFYSLYINGKLIETKKMIVAD